MATGGLFTAAHFIAMSDEHPLKLTVEAKQNKAIIKISGVIWEYNNSAAWFSSKIDEIVRQGITDAHVVINTPGGDVFQANEIANEIEKFTGTLTGEGGSLVASAGTYIAMSLSSFTMPENGQFMYHKPSAYLRGNEDQLESSLKLLKSFTADYKKRYAEKTIHSEAEIEANWSKGDVWLNAQEAKQQKFITGISSRKTISKADALLMKACGSPVVPEITTKKEPLKTENEMDLKVAAVKIGLPETATQAEYDAAILAMQNKANKTDQLEKEVEEAEKKRRSDQIKAIFDQAIKAKKITAAQAENMQGWAEKDFDGFKAHIDALEGLEKPNPTGQASPTGASASITGKKFEELTEEEAQTLEDEDPETFNALYEAYLEE